MSILNALVGLVENTVSDGSTLLGNPYTAYRCWIAVISHVDKLNESIPQKILVTNTGSGSKIEMIQ
jgi:DNA repair exonuclease SbcCD ATPase subunit